MSTIGLHLVAFNSLVWGDITLCNCCFAQLMISICEMKNIFGRWSQAFIASRFYIDLNVINWYLTQEEVEIVVINIISDSCWHKIRSLSWFSSNYIWQDEDYFIS